MLGNSFRTFGEFASIVSEIHDDWVFVSDSKTSLSRPLISSILPVFTDRSVIYGRTGCLPTSYASLFTTFKKCHHYPIIQSGFLFHTTISNSFTANETDFLLGIAKSVQSTPIVEDTSFSFLPFDTEHHTKFPRVSFYPDIKSIAETLKPYAGLRFRAWISKFTLADFVLGSRYTVSNRTLQITDELKIVCSNETKVPSQSLYSYPVKINIVCY